MKKRILFAAFLSFSLLGASACSDKDDDKKAAPIVNNTGNNSFKAKINGTDISSSQVIAGYGDVDNERVISINATTSMGQITLIFPDQTGTFTRSNSEIVNGMILEGQGTNAKGWHSNPDGSETIIITKLDNANKKVSGTFSFTAKPVGNASGDKVVTEGSFTDLTIYE